MQASGGEGDLPLGSLVRGDDTLHKNVKRDDSTEVGDMRDRYAGQGVFDDG